MQYLAAKHEAKQIEEIADNLGKDLPPADLAKADALLNSNYFYDSENEDK